MVKVQGKPAIAHEASGHISVYSARSASRPFMRHFVLWSDDDNDVLLCTCEGWQAHAKCWHEDELRSLMTGEIVEHLEDQAARAHLVMEHNIDTSRLGNKLPAQRLLELRAEGECVHNVEGFDNDNDN